MCRQCILQQRPDQQHRTERRKLQSACEQTAQDTYRDQTSVSIVSNLQLLRARETGNVWSIYSQMLEYMQQIQACVFEVAWFSVIIQRLFSYCYQSSAADGRVIVVDSCANGFAAFLHVVLLRLTTNSHRPTRRLATVFGRCNGNYRHRSLKSFSSYFLQLRNLTYKFFI